MDARIRSRLADGLNYYKDGSLTLEQVLNGFEEVLKDYSPEPEVKPACDEQVLQGKIDENEYWLKFLNADYTNIIHKSFLMDRIKFLENENRKSV